ncbi:hypothetical protein [Verrucosispora sp. NA02020]|uniref:hypothetical protein n=1 Tax=Verrucosispora sp. NA02020 TaxID=2742132 RepID=UPI00159059EE|nr:hypothetical protein [Verrucosispora sp. NA02020]QKW15441.1 hypothetical protein HUT12_23515 [Verrucosispora sp. NA02020]
MFTNASVTIGYSSTEIRPTRAIRGADGERQTVRVRPGRANSRRAAINASLGYGR